MQAHPEIDPETGRALLEGIAVKAPQRAGLVASGLEQEPRDDRVVAELVRRFLAL